MADRGPSPHTPLPTNNEEKSERDNRRTRRSRSRIRSTHRRSRSWSRTFLQKFTRSRRHTHRRRTRNRSSSSDSSNSTPKRYSRKRRASSSFPVTAASRSTSDSASSESYETRKSRSRSRHPPKSKKYGKRQISTVGLPKMNNTHWKSSWIPLVHTAHIPSTVLKMLSHRSIPAKKCRLPELGLGKSMKRRTFITGAINKPSSSLCPSYQALLVGGMRV